MYDNVSRNELPDILLGFQYGQMEFHATAVEMSKEHGHKSFGTPALDARYDKQDALGLSIHGPHAAREEQRITRRL